MVRGKYENFTEQELIAEIARLKEKKKSCLGQLDINSVNRDLKIIVHILNRRKS